MRATWLVALLLITLAPIPAYALGSDDAGSAPTDADAGVGPDSGTKPAPPEKPAVDAGQPEPEKPAADGGQREPEKPPAADAGKEPAAGPDTGAGAQPPEPEPSQEGGDAPAQTPTPPPDKPSVGAAANPISPDAGPGPEPATPAAVAPVQAENPETASETVAPEPDTEGEVLGRIGPGVNRAPFTLYVNEVEKGIAVLVLKDDDVLMLASDTVEAGLILPGGHEVMFEGERMVSLKSLSPPLKYVLDEHTISLRITAPVTFLPSTTVDLALGPPTFQRQSVSSMFWNYSLRVIDALDVESYQELGASVHGSLMFSSMYMSSLLGPRRGLTNYTINEPEKLRRFVIGDALVTSGVLGGGQLVGGWTMTRSYDLNPYAVKAPRIGFQGSTLTPATIDVYVNGVRVRSEPVQPGTFQLSNLRVAGGKGSAVYVIRDVFGQEQRIELPFYIASTVLAKGLDEFTYSLGFIRTDVGTKSWGYTTPAGVARHRYGYSDNLTVGYRAEYANQAISGGPGATALTPLGQVEVELGASATTNKGTPGGAAFGSYSYQTRKFSTGFAGTLLTDHYGSLSIRSADDRAVRELAFFGSLPLHNIGNLSANVRYSDYRDAGRSWSVGGQASVSVVRSLFAMLFGSYQVMEQGYTNWQIMLNASWQMKRGDSVQGNTTYNNNGPSASLSINHPTPMNTSGYGYRAFGQYNSAGFTGEGRLQYQASVGRYAIGYANFNGQSHAAVEVAGALALVPGIGIFPTLPVQNAFGVLRVPGVKGVTGMLNNQVIGKTDRRGNLLVPNVLAYYGNRFSVATNDLPLEYQLEKTEQILAPPMRGAVVATFDAVRPHFYRGNIVWIDLTRGKRIVPEYGQVRIPLEEGEALSPLGKQGEFELSDLKPGRHKAYVDYLDRVCEFELEARESTETVIEMGTLTCSQISQRKEP